MNTINFYYCDVSAVTEQDFSKHLARLPAHMQKEVLSYKFFKDRKLKLFSKLLVFKYFTQKIPFKWSDIKVTPKGKPYIENEESFNISHTGDIACAAFCKGKIGADIERMRSVNFKNIAAILHKEEARHISCAKAPAEAFFKIWTKKEAFLKALGLGIMADLSCHNVLEDKITQSTGNWFIKTFNIEGGYIVSVCADMPDALVKINRIEISDLL